MRDLTAGLYREIGTTRPGEAPRYGAEGARHGTLRDDTVRDTAHNTWPATRRASTRVDAATRQGAPVTRPGQAYDTARQGLRHGAVCAQVGPRVGALCTRLSFHSVHYSESLFGTLFKNTVHEISKIKIK